MKKAMFKAMFKCSVVLMIISLFLVSCATSVHRGVVAMEIDENTAHVGLGKSEAGAGDHVELYAHKCRNIRSSVPQLSVDQVCTKVSRGHGRVTTIINDDYVVVKFDTGVSFEEGDFIEKHSH